MSNLREDVRNGDIYVYKLTCDNGGAPCIYNGVLSLSICKPKIRMAAQRCDWIVGFGGKSVPDLRGRLIYIARITQVVEHGDYYALDEYKDRPDCVYRRTPTDGYEYYKGSRYHDEEALTHDLGFAPNYERARNLLSDMFTYFGAEPGPSLDSVMHIYEGLPRDFVKNHAPEIRSSLQDFIVYVFEFERLGPGKHGEPMHANPVANCSQSEDDVIVVRGCSK